MIGTRDADLCGCRVDVRQHVFQRRCLSLHGGVVLAAVYIQQRYLYFFKRKRFAHWLLIVGGAHADADVGINALAAMLLQPCHAHVYAATVCNQYDALHALCS